MYLKTIFAQEIKSSQDNDVIVIQKDSTSVDVLLGMGNDIDSTHYTVKSINHLNNEVVKKYRAIDNPYTLNVPISSHEYSEVIVHSYYQGQKIKNDTCKIYFRQNSIKTLSCKKN